MKLKELYYQDMMESTIVTVNETHPKHTKK